MIAQKLPLEEEIQAYLLKYKAPEAPKMYLEISQVVAEMNKEKSLYTRN